MKKILFVLNAAGGGATQGIREYLRFQNHKDINAFIAIPEKPSAEQLDWIKKYAVDYLVADLPWWNIPNGMSFRYKWLLYFRNLWIGKMRSKGTGQLIEYIKEHKIDAVYTGSILIKEGALAAKKLKIPHYWHIKETFGTKGRVQFRKSDPELQQFILAHSSAVICMTQYIRSFFTEFENSPKLMVISDGINPLDFEIDIQKRNALRKQFHVQENEILIGMVASLSSIWKNHEVFIRAAGMIKDDGNVKFIAFGPEPRLTKNEIYNTPYRYFQKLKALVKENGLEHTFIWAGFHGDVPAIFQALDIFVHPCETEPFGRVIIESMASTKVTLVPDQGGSSEPIKDSSTGVKYKSGDAQDLSKKLLELIYNKENRRQLGQKARSELINSSYTLEQYSKSLTQLFKVK